MDERRRVRELDRLLFTEATSIALFESLLELPRLHLAWVVGFGAIVQSLAATALGRRYS